MYYHVQNPYRVTRLLVAKWWSRNNENACHTVQVVHRLSVNSIISARPNGLARQLLTSSRPTSRDWSLDPALTLSRNEHDASQAINKQYNIVVNTLITKTTTMLSPLTRHIVIKSICYVHKQHHMSIANYTSHRYDVNIVMLWLDICKGKLLQSLCLRTNEMTCIV